MRSGGWSASCRATCGRRRGLGTAADAASVAAAIERRRPDEWDDATLGTLRDEAMAAGAVLRRIAAAAEAAEDR